MGPSVKCTYASCNSCFDSEKLMKKHKKYSAQHDFCSPCNYDAKDWEDLLRHKVDGMAPYLLGIKILTKENKKKGERIPHIVCEFCGEDFKTWQGREDHRDRLHQKAQALVCQGNGPMFDVAVGAMAHSRCSGLFASPSQLIMHYERGECNFISRKEFQTERQQKHIVKQIMKDPDFFTRQLCENKVSHDEATADWEMDENVDDSQFSRKIDQNLLDRHNQEQVAGAEVLNPTIVPPNLMDPDMPITRQTHETWPRAPCADIQSLPVQMQGLTISNPNEASISTVQQGIANLDLLDIEMPQEIPLSVPWAQQADLASYLERQPITAEHIAKWNEDIHNSRECEPGASIKQDVPLPDDAVRGINLFRSHWWDSNSKDYTPDLFYHTITGKYRCPFGGCDAIYDEQSAIESHLRAGHVLPPITCPLCCKHFNTVAALVSHFEASVRGSKCKIARTKDFERIMDEVTGGFVEVEVVKGDKLVGYKAKGIGEQRTIEHVDMGDLLFAGVERAVYTTDAPMREIEC